MKISKAKICELLKSKVSPSMLECNITILIGSKGEVTETVDDEARINIHVYGYNLDPQVSNSYYSVALAVGRVYYRPYRPIGFN